MGFWQTHESFAHPQMSGDKNMIANLNPPAAAIAAHAKAMFTSPPDEGHAIHAEITTDGKVTINGAKVVKTDIACKNGVIHVIDTVLMPPAE